MFVNLNGKGKFEEVELDDTRLIEDLSNLKDLVDSFHNDEFVNNFEELNKLLKALQTSEGE